MNSGAILLDDDVTNGIFTLITYSLSIISPKNNNEPYKTIRLETGLLLDAIIQSPRYVDNLVTVPISRELISVVFIHNIR